MRGRCSHDSAIDPGLFAALSTSTLPIMPLFSCPVFSRRVCARAPSTNNPHVCLRCSSLSRSDFASSGFYLKTDNPYYGYFVGHGAFPRSILWVPMPSWWNSPSLSIFYPDPIPATERPGNSTLFSVPCSVLSVTNNTSRCAVDLPIRRVWRDIYSYFILCLPSHPPSISSCSLLVISYSTILPDCHYI